jgi:hypothetical protein
MSVTAEEWQLLSFFEVEPSLRDAGEPWDYNDALYDVRQGDLSLSFAIAPAYRDVRLILKHHADIVYELNIMGVKDVQYGKAGGSERLTIKISDHDEIELLLRPRIEIKHNIRRQWP